MRLFITIICLLMLGTMKAQLPGWSWSEMRSPYSDKADSALAVNGAKQIWKHPGALNGGWLGDGNNGEYAFHGRDGLGPESLKPSLDSREIDRIRFADFAELISIWNPGLDTCMLLSYEPMIYDRSGSLTRIDTTCWLHCSLFDYQKYSTKEDFEKKHQLTVKALAHALGGQVFNDTIFRVVRYVADSNEYLPQAQYHHLGLAISWRLYSRELIPYGKKELQDSITYLQWDALSSEWDSTNYVEYPPGTFIHAPIKMFRPVSVICLYEKWIPDTLGLPRIYEWSPVKYYLRYTRQVVSYGLIYEGDGIVWVDADLTTAALRDVDYNLQAFEESFRTERFLRMHVAISPY